MRPTGTDLELLDKVDRLWNLCVSRGGWNIACVLALSRKPASVTLDDESGEVKGGRGYPDDCRGVESAHPIDLACEGRQRKGYDRVKDASRILEDICRALAMADGLHEERLRRVTRGAYEHVTDTSEYFKLRAYTWDQHKGGVDKATAREAASSAARANGMFNCICFCVIIEINHL